MSEMGLGRVKRRKPALNPDRLRCNALDRVPGPNIPGCVQAHAHSRRAYHSDVIALRASSDRTYMYRGGSQSPPVFSAGPFKRVNAMSNRITHSAAISHVGSCRTAAFAVVVLLSLTAVTSANAASQSSRTFQGFGNFQAPARPTGRTWYSPQSSMVAPPMQRAAPIHFPRAYSRQGLGLCQPALVDREGRPN